jgi:phosphoglycolate phosphatase-like HAD superfamily hydrolase
MHAVIFDIDHTLFDAEKRLHAGVADLLTILNRLGYKLAAISSSDHRALVQLDEAGIGKHFAHALCTAHIAEPKAVAGINHLLDKMGLQPHQATLVSHAHADILLAKDAGLAKAVGVSHNASNVESLQRAGADVIAEDLPTVLGAIG